MINVIECPYCAGRLKIQEDVRHIGAYEIICENCGALWVDEDDLNEEIL